MQRNEELKPETANSTPLRNSQGRVGWNTEDAMKKCIILCLQCWLVKDDLPY